MSWIAQQLWLIPALPLGAAAISSVLPREQRKVSAGLAIGAMSVSLLLSCLAVFLVPRTTVLGAILLTGYLGGATATSLQMGAGFMSLVPVSFGVLAWGGLFLRDPRMRALLPLRTYSTSLR